MRLYLLVKHYKTAYFQINKWKVSRSTDAEPKLGHKKYEHKTNSLQSLNIYVGGVYNKNNFNSISRANVIQQQ